ncbi:MAG: cupin protein [Mycobacterium sp.]|nr:cupin protein [Mycobacterium sp.]
MKTVRWFALVAIGNLAAALPASMALSATASATPSENTDAIVISQSTVDGVDYITREITIQPGGSTGWHYHDGRVFGVIREGTLTRTMADCSVVVSPAGSAVVEDRGPDHVHIGRNLGPEPLTMWIDYIEPAGAPLAVDVPDPGCGS